MALSESAFASLGKETLENMLDTIENNLGDFMDVDLVSGILKIELDEGGEYVINLHAPNQQIWMSSPVSGATHYSYDEASETWVSTKGEADLMEVLAAELSKTTGESFSF
ncbi:MAG: iron donor protein CyaY [Rhodospirillales bacterium]|nr:iron donor protein CyaY [Rhodospirillales bacterium]